MGPAVEHAPPPPPPRAQAMLVLSLRARLSGWNQLERKLFALFKESGDLDFPHEDWVFDVLPELNSLENETLDTLLAQAQMHAKCAPRRQPSRHATA